jgi:hypothetical protein
MSVRTLTLAFVVLAACGNPFSSAESDDGGSTDASPIEAGTTADACMPQTCGELGWECSLGGGQDPDGCKGQLDCGGCKEALSLCSSTHTCTCQPLTCSSSIYGNPQCGTYPDGCAGTITCGVGNCPDVDGGTQSCVQGKCVAGSCTPKTCAAGQCGPIENGCGGILNCPTNCPGMETCGGGGQTGVCGCDSSNPCETLNLGCGTAVNGCGTAFKCGGVPQPDPSTAHQIACGGDKGSTYFDCCSDSTTGDSGIGTGLGQGPIQPTCVTGPAPDPEPNWVCTVPGTSGTTGSSTTAWCCTSAPGG